MSKILLTLMCVLALGLTTACGSSGKRAVASLVVTPAEQTTAILKAIEKATNAVHILDGESTDAEVTAAEEAIAAARKAVTDADALSGDVKDEFSKQISRLDKDLADKRADIATARRESAAAGVENLSAALAGTRITGISAAVKHGAPPVMSGTLPGTPPVPVAGLETAAVRGSEATVGSWKGLPTICKVP